MRLTEWLTKQGYHTISSNYYTNIDEWMEWYKGKVDSFHRYNIYNGIEQVGCVRYSLGMPKMICEDWASLILNERVTIEASGFGSLQEILDRNNFRVRGNQLIELAFASGTGAFVEYIGIDGLPIIDYVHAERIYPLSWDNGDITECAFASYRRDGEKKYYYVQIHKKENGRYKIFNHYVDAGTGQDLPLPENMLPVIDTKSIKPLFQIVMPNIVNNLDIDCPLGISVFANAIDAIKNADLVFDSYANEFILGRKRIFVDINATQTEVMDGVVAPVFDAHDVVFYAFDNGNPDEEKKITEIDMTLRAQEHETALQRALATISSKCGLGNTRYQFEGGGAKTATEVISEKSDLYQNLCKHEIIVRKALTDMVESLAFLMGANAAEVKIDFDDSIITDRQSDFNYLMQLVAAGAAEPWELRAYWLGETEEQARARVPSVSELIG